MKKVAKPARTSSKDLQKFIQKRFTKPFQARDVQMKFGDQKTMIHISSARAALSTLVKEGHLRVEGVGRARHYVPVAPAAE